MSNRIKKVDTVLKGVESLTKDSKDNTWGFKLVSNPTDTYAIVTMGDVTWRVWPEGASWSAEIC